MAVPLDNRNQRSQLLLHLVVLIFGFTAILGKLISLDATVLVWYRLLIALVGIGVWLGLTRQRATLSPSLLAVTTLTGLLIGAHWILFFAAIKAANVSITVICLSLSPFIVAFIEPWAFGRGVRPYEVIFGLLAVLGLGLIFRVEQGYRAGFMLALAAAALASIFVVINAVLVRRQPAAVISFYELLGALAGLTCYLLLRNTTAAAFTPSGADLVWLLMLGLVCTAFAHIAAIEVMRVLSPYTVTLTVNLEPVYGILLALIVFGDTEYMSPGFYAGAGLVMLTILANTLIKNKLARSHQT